MIRNQTVLEVNPSHTGDGNLPEAHLGTDGELVSVRQNVLATVDHACGNIFQRLYHLLRTIRSGDNHAVSAAVPALEESVRELQGLLELFIDYVAPMHVEPRPLRCADLVTSLRRHLEDELGPHRVQMRIDDEPVVTAAVDAARLGRVFQLIARSVGDTGVLNGTCGLSADRAHFEMSLALPAASGPDAELRLALAEKLVELQGGELRHSPLADRSQWLLRLPVVAA